MNELNRDNFAPMLNAFLKENALSQRRVATTIGCSEPTLNRLLSRETLPSDEMLKQSGVLIDIGFTRYSKLSKAEKEKISEAIGAVGGGRSALARSRRP
jgi:transcriptional regulator with XRE-family HTH domain